jgi:hypothetical protein
MIVIIRGDSCQFVANKFFRDLNHNKHVKLYKKAYAQSTNHPSDPDARRSFSALLFCPVRIKRRCDDILGDNGSGHAGRNEKMIP